MSTDLHVYARRQPKAVDLDAFVAIQAALTSDAPLRRDGHILLSDAAGIHVELDGPVKVEPEDLPDAASGALSRPGWFVQLSIKPSADVDWPMALAAHLARATDGVVYDPQEDRVTWPSGFRPRGPGSTEERIDEVELAWFSPLAGTDPSLPLRLLSLLRARAPELLPVRYGDVEPLPYRLEGPGADEEFVDRWVQVGMTFLPMLFWSSTRPCFGGSAWMSRTEDESEPEVGRPIVKVSVSLDGRALARDPELTDRMVELFAELAVELSCIYAAASLQRDMIVKRGRSSFDGRTESSPVPFASRWMGLPAAPTWLAWFGPPYAERVRSTVAPFIRREREGGLLVRLTREPADRDVLANLFPALPLELIARRKGKPAAWEPDVRYSFASGPPSELADLVP